MILRPEPPEDDELEPTAPIFPIRKFQLTDFTDSSQTSLKFDRQTFVYKDKKYLDQFKTI